MTACAPKNHTYVTSFGILNQLVEKQVNTVFQLALVAGALLQPEFGNPDTQTWINYLRYYISLFLKEQSGLVKSIWSVF